MENYHGQFYLNQQLICVMKVLQYEKHLLLLYLNVKINYLNQDHLGYDFKKTITRKKLINFIRLFLDKYFSKVIQIMFMVQVIQFIDRVLEKHFQLLLNKDLVLFMKENYQIKFVKKFKNMVELLIVMIQKLIMLELNQLLKLHQVEVILLMVFHHPLVQL